MKPVALKVESIYEVYMKPMAMKVDNRGQDRVYSTQERDGFKGG